MARSRYRRLAQAALQSRVKTVVLLGIALGLVSGPAAAYPAGMGPENYLLLARLESITTFIARLLAYLAFLIGAIMFVIGGIEYLTAQSSVERDSRGRQRIVKTLAGLGIASAAIAFVQVLEGGLGITPPDGAPGANQTAPGNGTSATRTSLQEGAAIVDNAVQAPIPGESSGLSNNLIQTIDPISVQQGIEAAIWGITTVA